MHPYNTGPEYRDEDEQPARLVRCPDCGQMEWWTERECMDHGRCRAVPRSEPCPVCGEALTKNEGETYANHGL